MTEEFFKQIIKPATPLPGAVSVFVLPRTSLLGPKFDFNALCFLILAFQNIREKQRGRWEMWSEGNSEDVIFVLSPQIKNSSKAFNLKLHK